VLIARICEVFPLLCPLCGGQMRLIAFTTEGTQIRRILDHIGVDSEPPHIAPARGPPLWDDCSDAQTDEGVHIEPADWDLAAQSAPDYEVDQRINPQPQVPQSLCTHNNVDKRGLPTETVRLRLWPGNGPVCQPRSNPGS
jgi:hypothetical protein